MGWSSTPYGRTFIMVLGVLLVLWGAASVFGEFLEVRLTEVLETSDEQPPPRAAHSSVLVGRELISIFVFGLLEFYASRRHTGFIHTMAGTPEPLRGSSVHTVCHYYCVSIFLCAALCVPVQKPFVCWIWTERWWSAEVFWQQDSWEEH